MLCVLVEFSFLLILTKLKPPNKWGNWRSDARPVDAAQPAGKPVCIVM